jgi:hypothetical protein
MDVWGKPLDLEYISACLRMIDEGTNLENFSTMRSPRIAEAPGAVFVPVVDLDFAINGAGCEAISIAVEGSCFNHISVAMLEERKAFLVRVYWTALHHW